MLTVVTKVFSSQREIMAQPSPAPTSYQMATYSLEDSISNALIGIEFASIIIAVIDIGICLKNTDLKEFNFGIMTYISVVIGILSLYAHGAFSMYRYDNNLCSFDPNEDCIGKCTRSNCKRSCSSYDCTKYGKDCSNECNLINTAIYWGYIAGSLEVIGLCILLFLLKQYRWQLQNGLYERFKNCVTKFNNYQTCLSCTEMLNSLKIEINEYNDKKIEINEMIKPEPSDFGVINVLQSKKGIPDIFIQNISKILTNPITHHSTIEFTNYFINLYFNNITRQYIVPTCIISICSDYFGDINNQRENNLCPPALQTRDEYTSLDRIYCGLNRDHSEKDIFARISGKYCSGAECEKLNGMIMIDINGDVRLSHGMRALKDGNIFIRCNNLSIYHCGIRTREREYDDDNNETKQLHKSLKRDSNRYGNVILIVRDKFDIKWSTISTGFLYINCGSYKAHERVEIQSARQNMMIIVNGKRLHPVSDSDCTYS